MPRRSQAAGTEPLQQLRCMCELVSVFHFLSLFREKFEFLKFSIEEFETFLLEENSIVIADIISRTLRFALKRTDILYINYEPFLHQFLKENTQNGTSIPNDLPFQELPPSHKLIVLKILSELVHSLNSEELGEYLDEHYSPEDMRFQPVGIDSQNNTYWYFDDLRLYKENLNPRKNQSPWECICASIEEWRAFLRQIRVRKKPLEASLYHYLKEQVLPIIQGPLLEKRFEFRQRRKLLKAAEQGGKEAEVLQEISQPKFSAQEVLRREKAHILKMSEELTKLAKLANNAAGDFTPNSHALSPPTFGKYPGGGMMQPIKDDKSMRIKSELNVTNFSKLESIKEEPAMVNTSPYHNLNSNMNVMDIKKENFMAEIKKEEFKKEENGAVFHDSNTGSNTDKHDVPPPLISEKGDCIADQRPSPAWTTTPLENHMAGENHRMDGAPFPHMSMPYQHPRHYPGPTHPHHQSHVFSTLLANRAAQAVYTGQTDSIITFHQSLTAKRKFLDPEQDTQGETSLNPASQLSSCSSPSQATPGRSTPQTNSENNLRTSNTNSSLATNNNPGSKIDSVENSLNKQMNSKETENHSNGGTKENGTGDVKSKGGGNPRGQQNNVGVEPVRAPAVTESGSSAPTKGKAAPGGTKKNNRRKRQQPASQPLHPTMPTTMGPNMAMQGMPPSGPSFGPYPRGPYGPNGGPFPPQNPQIAMGMRPGMPPQSLPTPTTETENLDPSALWETPPSAKRQMMNSMAPSWSQDFMINQGMGPQGPGSGPVPGMIPRGPNGMMGPRHFMGPSPQQEFPGMSLGGPPYDMPNYSPGQSLDNMTPEQIRHRQEGLQRLKEMQKMLFPEEHQNSSPTPGRMLSPHGNIPPEMMNQQMMGSPPGPVVGPPAMMGPRGPHPQMMPGMHPRMPPPEALRGMTAAEQQRYMMQQNMIPPVPPDWENMTPEQRAWYKLQQDFYMEKQRKMMDEQNKMSQSQMMDFPGRGPMRESMNLGMGPGPGAGPFSPGDVMGQNMPPPPPYHANHSAASALQRRASMSGFPSGGTPSPFPMSPHSMPPSSQASSGRLARSNSLPSAQMPVGPGGAMSMQAPMSPQHGSPIRPSFRASTPTPGMTASTNVNMNSLGSNPAMTSGMPPTAAPPSQMNTNINSPAISCDNIPLSNTPNMMDHQSPHSHQPGTPQPVIQSASAVPIRQGTPNPGTPQPAVSIAKSAMVTSGGNGRCLTPKSNPDPSVITQGADNSSSSGGDSRKSGDGNIMSQQKLVNFPPSQLNRDKAPNFPPRGEDLQQYTSTFYQKSVSKEMSRGPGRMFGSPPMHSPLSADMMGTPHVGGNMMSPDSGMIQANMMSQPSGMMTSSGMMPTSQSPSLITSQSPVMMSSQSPALMTSQSPGLMASQASIMMSQSPVMVSQPQMMASQPRMASQVRMMHHPPLASSPHAPIMVSQGPMLKSHSPIITSQSSMMTSQPGMMPDVMDGHPGMMNSHAAMMSSPSNMMQQQMSGPMHSNGPMMSPGMRMPNTQGMMQQDGMMGPSMGPSHGPMLPHHHGAPSPVGMMSPTMSSQSEMMMAQSKMNAQRQMMHSMGPSPGGHPMDSMGPGMEFPMGGPSMQAGGMPSRFPGPKSHHMTGGHMMDPSMHGFRPTGVMMDGGGMEPGMEPGMGRMMEGKMMSSIGMRQMQPTSPLSLLQSRFSPPLPPDNKGPTKTLQYFPPGANTQGSQGQGGNPHINPVGSQPTPVSSQGPKQIQMPFPMEMITSGPSSSPSLTHAMGPQRMMHGMGPRMGPSEMMFAHGEYPQSHRGPSQMSFMGPRHSMQYAGMSPMGASRIPGMVSMGPSMGPGMGPGYLEPGCGPQHMPGMGGMGMNGPMGPGFNLPR